MKTSNLARLVLACAIGLIPAGAFAAATEIPHLEKRDGMTKLIVDGQPFICVAGEVANASSSDPAAMTKTIANLAAAHLNTILTVVSWDLVEPEEGKFDFSMIDYQIEAARSNHVRLIFLWMGSWKNGLSHYPPEWVKADQERFPRVTNGEGNSLEILSTLSKANRDADAAAFAAVMRHIKEVDAEQHTVIAIQVENEIGCQGSTRDFRPEANAAFAGPVPEALTSYLEKNKANLIPEFKKIWDAAGDKTSGTWEEVFGKNVARPAADKPVPNSPGREPRAADAELYNHTDEIFMAWNYSQYVGYVAAQGKKEYPLPMYVNAWIVQPMDIGAGDYPSGGPEALVHDVWRAGAPAIDILAPDIYLPEFAQIVKQFARAGNPAWIPETRQSGDNCWEAFTELNALCYSPFGIDNLNPDSSFAQAYGFINSISGAIAEAQGKPGAIKLIKLGGGENPGKVEMGDYTFDFTPAPNARGGGARGRRGGGAARAEAAATTQTAGPGASAGLSFLDSPFLAIIQSAPGEFYFATNGSYAFQVASKTPGTTAAAASIDRGAFIDGLWVRSRRLNGDDIMGRGYDVSAAAAEHLSGTQVPLGARGRRGGGAAAGGAGGAGGETPAPTVTKVRIYKYH